MKTDTREKIYAYITKNAPIWATELSKIFSISPQIIHRHIKKLIEENKIIKSWNSPKVYYFPQTQETKKEISIFKNEKSIIDKNFILFNPNGEVLYWLEWFDFWCKKRNLDTIKEVKLYIHTLQKYEKYKNEKWIIDGLEKMKSSFEKVYLDKVYYLDFYSIEKYGKTKLWNLMFYWKQSQDKEIIKELFSYIKTPIFELIKNCKIDAYGFIPPSIKRKIQILDEIKEKLSLNIKELKIIKIYKNKIVAQKSLSKKEDRIINAWETIYIKDKNFFCNTILLIDDAIWSWATLNETAKKIKEFKIAKKVIGLAIVWSYKWFEVINEV